MMKRLRLIAGPNGSGKTTLFRQLNKCIPLYDFINADEIKVQLEKEGRISLCFEPEQSEMVNAVNATNYDDSIKTIFADGLVLCSGKTVQFMPEAINSYSVAAFTDFLRYAYLKRGLSFTAETVFSHPSKLEFLSRAQSQGYRIYLYCIATESPELNVARVTQRYASGGHYVQPDKIISRYARCLDNFYEALQYAYRAFFWDNSTDEMRFFAELSPEHFMNITDEIPGWFQKHVLDKIQA